LIFFFTGVKSIKKAYPKSQPAEAGEPAGRKKDLPYRSCDWVFFLKAFRTGWFIVLLWKLTDPLLLPCKDRRAACSPQSWYYPD
jgi:hypothetical protein